MVGKRDREKSRENCVGAGKRRSNEAPKEQTIWGVGGGGGHEWFGFGDNFFPKPPVIELFPWHTKVYDLLQNYAPRKILFSRYEFFPRFFLAEGFSLEISLRLDLILEYQLLV